jgi:hypothetical protein
MSQSLGILVLAKLLPGITYRFVSAVSVVSQSLIIEKEAIQYQTGLENSFVRNVLTKYYRASRLKA